MNASSISKFAFIRSFLHDWLSVIDIFAMSNTNYFDDQSRRGNGIDDAVRAFSYPISTFRTDQLFDSGRGKGFSVSCPTARTILTTTSLGRYLSSLIADRFHSILYE